MARPTPVDARAGDPAAHPAAHPAEHRAAHPADDPAVARFADAVRAALADGSLVRLQLGRPHPPAAADLHKLLLRPVQLRGQPHLQAVWRHATQDITKNQPLAEALDGLPALIGAQFHHAHLVTRSRDVQLVHDRKGRWALRAGKLAGAGPAAAPAANADPEGHAAAARPGGAAPPAHDRARHRPLALTEPWLAALGITDAQARLVPAMARKWRQINRFAEILHGALAASPLATRAGGDTPVRVLDFGAGKGYLTFAVHALLREQGFEPEVVGVELRESLTAPINATARALGLHGLRFEAGDVRQHAADGVDVMIALHACDTATDVALHRGIAAGAAIIVCSPCCHKELRPQIQVPEVLQPMLRDGIHLTASAEMLTDSLRALLLRLHGYDAQVFEFIDAEATGRNRLVLAVRRARALPAAQQARLQQQLAALKAFWGIRSQHLEALLQADAQGLPPPREPLRGLPAAYHAGAEDEGATPDPADGVGAPAADPVGEAVPATATPTDGGAAA